MLIYSLAMHCGVTLKNVFSSRPGVRRSAFLLVLQKSCLEDAAALVQFKVVLFCFVLFSIQTF